MKRRLYKIVTLLILISIIASMTPLSLAQTGSFRTTACVNMRSEPSTEASVVTVVYTGTDVTVLEHDPAGWSKVQVGEAIGYIRSDFLKAPTGNSTAAFRTSAGVNLRASASTTSNVVSTVAEGTRVDVLEHNPDGWSRVKVGENTGYIRSDYLIRSGSDTQEIPEASATSSSSQIIANLKTTGAVNFRTGPSTGDAIIRSLAAGTGVEVLEQQSNGWSRVRHSGTEGFIRSDLLNESGTPQTTITLKTTDIVNIRTGPSTSNSIIKTLAANVSVEVLEQQSNGWSRVNQNGTTGFIRSDLLSVTGASQGGSSIGTLRTVTGVNFRTGPSTSDNIIRLLEVNTSVEVLENQANGWSKVRHNGTVGFIRSDLLGNGPRTIELINWSTARSLVPMRRDIRVVDVRTGISFNLRPFSISGHADVEPPTSADTDAILRTRNGVWAWTPRPVWVTVGDKTFAAALNGMPHDVSTISDNGMNGHLCLHFNETVTRSQSYQRNLNNAVAEAYNARPR